MGSVLEQENGNYLVYTFGNGISPECSVLEIIPNESFGGQVVWKATASNPNAAWYRAYKFQQFILIYLVLLPMSIMNLKI